MSRGSGLCPSCELALRKGNLQSDTLSCYLVWGTCSESWLPSSNCIAGIIDGSALLLTVVLLVIEQSSATKFFVSSIGPANWPHSSWWTYNARRVHSAMIFVVYNFLRFDAYTMNPNRFDAMREDKITVPSSSCRWSLLLRLSFHSGSLSTAVYYCWKAAFLEELIEAKPKRLHHHDRCCLPSNGQIVYVNCRFNASWCPSNDCILPILSSFSIIWANRMKRNKAGWLGGLP